MCQLKEDGGLGFRDLRKFNLSLLVKQGWRFISNLNSLLARVMKAKYFPRSNFLNTPLGNNPSYVWKSIWATKGVLSAYCAWRVGTGDNIDINNDAWFPQRDHHRLVNSVHSL